MSTDRTIKLCNCNQTMALDAKALAHALKLAVPVPIHSELCRREAGAFHDALQGGGVIGDDVVPCGRFNAGEKLWFWGGVIGLGTISCASGLVMDFPNFDQSRSVMMIANIVHAVAGVWFIAWSLTHIYLGTIGTTGAYEGMRDGYVDETWAREHAQYWYEDVKAGRRAPPSGEPGAAASTTTAPPQVEH